MADMFTLTPRPILLTGAEKQKLENALEVIGYDEIDVLCVIDAVVGTSTGLAIKIITGMQLETETGWVTLVGFTAASLTTAGSAEVVNANTKVLKYIRWEVTSIGGATSVTFDISGMLRRRTR